MRIYKVTIGYSDDDLPEEFFFEAREDAEKKVVELAYDNDDFRTNLRKWITISEIGVQAKS